MFKKSSIVFKTDDRIDASDKSTNKVNDRNIDSKQTAYHKATDDLNKLARGSARVILDIKAVFPFNFFPDEVIADEAKVSVHTNYFFYNKEVRSIEYKDIFNIAVQQGLFFATLEIVDRFFSQDPLIIPYLKKKDAIKARRILQGMIITKNEKIETQDLSINELVDKLERIGKSR